MTKIQKNATARNQKGKPHNQYVEEASCKKVEKVDGGGCCTNLTHGSLSIVF